MPEASVTSLALVIFFAVGFAIVNGFNDAANAIAPGFIDTVMTQQLPEDRKQELMNQVPLGFLGTPRDVAEVVAFLASEEAGYVTGVVINDGSITIVSSGPGEIRGTKWNDLDGDGVRDADEPGLRWEKLTLTVTYPNGITTTLATETDGYGFYSFDNLLLGKLNHPF